MKKNQFHGVFFVLLLMIAIVQSSQAGSVWRYEYQSDDTSSPDQSPSSLPTAYREAVSTLLADPLYPFNPDFSEQLDDWSTVDSTVALVTGLQARDNSGNDFGDFIVGYIEAPTTGSYLFGVASADNSELWLNTNNPNSYTTNIVRIAYEPGTGESLFVGNRLDTRVSAPIYLVQGQKYYFEARRQHGPGTGYFQIGWQRPDGVQEIIPALHLAQYEYNYYTGNTVTTPAFNVAYSGTVGGYLGGNITNAVALKEGAELQLPLDILAQQPTTFVWKTNGVVVPGQNLSYFDIQHTPATYNGVQVQAFISNAFGSITSRVATISVMPDTTPPTILTVDTAGNPNLVEVIYSKVIDPVSATTLSNYSITNTLGGALTITNATLSADQTTVYLYGTFNFSASSNYLLRVQNVKDQTSAGNILTPNPSTVAFTLTASLGNTYNFESGLPSGFTLFGNAYIETNGNVSAPSGSSFLALTDAGRSLNGAVLLTARNDIDQVHIKFKTRISDSGASVLTSQPWGDGFSVNIAPVLPLGTFATPQFGYSPQTPGPQFSVYFNARTNSVTDPPEIGVSLNQQVLTNIPAGINGIPLNGVPSIFNLDGHWAPVDINLHRDGTLDLAFDGVILLTNYPTPWVGLNSAQINFGASTEGYWETHWIDDLYINFGEGDIGNAGLASNSVLGGTFLEGSTVNLVAVPTGTGPFTYQWYENGLPISGANSRILTFTAVPGAGGNSGNYYLTVSNAFSGLVSSTNSIYIQPDLTPPAVVSARGIAGSVNEIVLVFNKPLNQASASAVSTYSSPYFIISAASLSQDGKTVTLNTTQQRVGATYPLTITGLKDTTVAGNILNTSITFSSSLSYKDEILADNPARYYKLDETSGLVAFTQTAIADVINTNGTWQNVSAVQAVPSLLPSAGSNDFAALFIAANTNWISIPNGGDINDYRGPWPKKSWELWFKANSFPPGAQPGDTAVQAQTHAVAGLWEEGGGQRDTTIYLWNSNTLTAPQTAYLTLHSYNSTADGPGAPFGLLNYPATYVTYPVTTGVTYHVVGVLDGDPNGRTGGLRLYVNGRQVAQITNGVGQLYNHNGDVEIGQGNARSHLNASGVFGAYDGIIDEVSTYNTVLSSNRILAHYLAGIGATTVATVPPTVVSSVDPRGNPNRLNVIFNQPVSAITATNLANYVIKTSGNATLPISSAQLGNDLKTVSLNGAFNFVVGNSYNVTVQGVADILLATNTVTSTNLVFTFVSAGSVGISGSSSLGSQVVTENQNAQFSVIATGQTPYSYQWLSNGVAWTGQTNAALSFNAAWNSGGNYSVVVNNEFSSITSSPPSVLTVLPDVSAPQIASLHGFAGTLNEIVITFNKPVDPVTATNLATYSIPTSGSTGLSLLGAAISTNGLQVTLSTTPQVHGQTNQLTTTNLKDRSHVPNTLTTTVSFVSTISYRDEILASGAVRYWTFDETNGSSFNTLVSKFDTSPANLVGTIAGTVNLGVPGLVPNVPNDTAYQFIGASTNSQIDLPNGEDINEILGPWPKITHIFSFKANSLPSIVNGTNTATVIYSHNYINFYIESTQTNATPTNAILVFKANNMSSDGPGAPWGGSTLATSKYITYPIVAGQTYNVVGVVDGNTSFSGQLRVYINGSLVGTVTGIGLIYKHPNYLPGIGQYSLTTHDGISINVTNAPFDGVLDEFALINNTLSDSRIAQLYSYSQTNWADSGFQIVSTPSAPTVNISFSNGLSLSWPTAAAGYYLEYTTNLASGIWVSNPVTPAVVGGFNVVSQPVNSSGNRFFRLHHP
jgi:hypothetical protein